MTAWGGSSVTNAHSADGTLSTTTVTPYDDAHGKTTVTLANGLTTTSAFDKAGRLVSVVQSSAATGKLGTTRYAYDADGRLLMTEGPTGQRSWMLYDAAGRKVADVDAAGALTEYVYNANNQVTETIQYDTAVDVTKLVDAKRESDDRVESESDVVRGDVGVDPAGRDEQRFEVMESV